jgi:hypothetical protein
MRPMVVSPNILSAWDITVKELSEIVEQNSSMRGLMFGFVAEYKLRKAWLEKPGIVGLVRPSSHDRTRKYDFGFEYKGRYIRVEVKCLDTPSVEHTNGVYTGTFQCNASDKREITLLNGEKVTTNCLAVGGFDVLAVALFAFDKTWRFAFARNGDLPRSPSEKYTEAQRKYLLKSSMDISLPLKPPFSNDLFFVLNRLGKGSRI